jgi:hypothetical protein
LKAIIMLDLPLHLEERPENPSRPLIKVGYPELKALWRLERGFDGLTPFPSHRRINNAT